MNLLLNRAVKLYKNGDANSALSLCEQCLHADPTDVHAWALAAQIAIANKSYKLAVDALQRLVHLQPRNLDALMNLGAALGSINSFAQAVQVLKRVLEIKPDHLGAQSNLANCYFEMGLFEQAEQAARQAIALGPHESLPHFHLANALAELSRFQEANLAYEIALGLQPGNANIRKNFSLNLMRLGDMERGAREYEARWKADGLLHPEKRLGKPVWDGTSAIRGRTLYLYGEQGLGDQIQFLRFADVLRDAGARVVLQLHNALLPLASFTDCFDELIGENAEVPEFDEHCPLMSIPRALGLTLSTIPAVTSYLRAPTSLVDHWKERLVGKSGFRIGIAWQGNVKTKQGPSKAIDLRCFEPLAKLDNVKLFSLQKDSEENELQKCGFELTSFSGEANFDKEPFLDTAAMISLLDLVVTCDTSIAHLAAALGKPTWILLKKVPDWRWLLERRDSPWYPTATLFRQPEPGDWISVFNQVTATLHPLLPDAAR